jgi:hypothetical protein
MRRDTVQQAAQSFRDCLAADTIYFFRAVFVLLFRGLLGTV